MSKGLTLTIIFQANSLNYGEGMGNVSELKKLSRSNGHTYTFASRQCLRYDIVRLGNELFNWNLQTVVKNNKTIQFRPDASIRESEEMDLFGYMKTVKTVGSITREAVARLTHAISLEPYRSDMDFLNNMGLARRIDEDNNLANIEQHFSFYTYTVTIDLDRIGEDKEISLSSQEKAQRVTQLLTILNLLNRNIRGRQENLSPLFLIGGMYDIANPFFYGRVKLDSKNGGFALSPSLLHSALEKKYGAFTVMDQTHMGLTKEVFDNEEELTHLLPEGQVHTVQGMFDFLIDEVNRYFVVNE
ncbi:type I-B CRISPR-associated protein Cas7/Cst2/DevR [Thermoflavimicrobium daqui]|uniref:Type I-B CRISPR-associated protein Cas7/Cst2/DevR n=1 Tax=Thermoflavimicrobium daqui TaxID=2137476 RepID=A0A364K7L0_9BACL|nr:type I-B CRISPR-associated protein Cas7/Cst2/DevR [Thermoflavimicrobium daqui]RAL26190.1 type I-B CRISPR-associated protein Cas7/Cst2/DevR [Thermoflavimicrobium daqui]